MSTKEEIDEEKIFLFLGSSGKTTQQIAEEFKITHQKALTIMLSLSRKKKTSSVSQGICKPTLWVRKYFRIQE